MSVQSFITSFNRSAARRGTPRKLVSDNGKTFTAAAKALKAISENEAVSKFYQASRLSGSLILRELPGGEVFLKD